MVEIVGAGLLLSAHDCSDGGLAVTLAECSADTNEIGCEVAIPTMAGGIINSLFGESASNVVVSVRKKDVSRVIELVNAASLPWLTLGHSGGKRVRISIGDEDVVDAPLDEVAQAWSTGVSRYFEDSAA